MEVLAIDPRYFRPTEVDLLIGDPTKAQSELRWQPRHTLDSLIEDMMQADVALFERERYLRAGGHKIPSSNDE
jgi:GDPmannose 4,6-dehydratase